MMDYQRRKQGSKDEKIRKYKVIVLEERFKYNVNDITKQLTVGMSTLLPFKRLDIQSEKLSKSELTGINEDSE